MTLKLLASLVSVVSLSLMAQQAEVGQGAGNPPRLFDSAVEDATQAIIPVTSLENSKKFYESLGCRLAETRDKSILLSAGGMRIRLVIAKGFAPANYPVMTWRFRDMKDVKLMLKALNMPIVDWREIPDHFAYVEAFLPPVGSACVKDPDGHLLQFAEWKDLPK
jgi:catechol 2,3-dioxygenase-like lactoylglutathione lyase family enzyme